MEGCVRRRNRLGKAISPSQSIRQGFSPFGKAKIDGKSFLINELSIFVISLISGFVSITSGYSH
jgi:hypothetical protein